jgi:hypothetical protein
MDRVLELLKLMASSAGEQVKAFPDFVVVADEIALLFDDEMRFADGQGLISKLDAVALERLRAIGERLERMTGKSQFWTLEALGSAPEWDFIRRTACSILSDLGVPRDPPNLGWVTYIPA